MPVHPSVAPLIATIIASSPYAHHAVDNREKKNASVFGSRIPFAISPRPQYILLHVSCYLFLTSVCAVDASQCKSPPADQSKSATFSCAVHVTFLRQQLCSAAITERYIFPHTTGMEFHRGIPALNDIQKVTDISVRRDGKNTTHSFARAKSDDEVRISVPTVESKNTVVISISYRLSNATFDFRRSCNKLNAKPAKEENANIMRWRSGKLDKRVNFLAVTFLTTDSNATLRILSSKFKVTNSSRTNTTAVAKNAKDVVEVYAKELGTKTCPVDLKCFDRKEGGGLPWYAILLIVSVSLSIAAGVLRAIDNYCRYYDRDAECDLESCLTILEICGICCSGGGDDEW